MKKQKSELITLTYVCPKTGKVEQTKLIVLDPETERKFQEHEKLTNKTKQHG
jgi:hypothetical protein